MFSRFLREKNIACGKNQGIAKVLRLPSMIDRLDKKLVYWSRRTIIEVSLRFLKFPGVSHMESLFFSHSGMRLTRKNPTS
jgi:hypothetical protein